VSAVYAVVLVIGILVLIAWIVAHSLAVSTGRQDRDPELRFGIPGRRVVAALVGFGMAGMSATYAAIEISAPVVVLLALAGAAATAWWAGVIDVGEPEEQD
jgi:hypothetical protein